MVESTHHVSIRDDRVLKTYRQCYGDEHQREWTALRLLHQYAPGLAPEPIQLRTSPTAPMIQTARVPGQPLGRTQLNGQQTEALGLALQALHTSVPGDVLSRLPQRRWAPAALTDALRSWLRQPRTPASAEVESALESARLWADGPEAACTDDVETAFAHGDGNIGNVVWDGDRCAIVDFEDSGRGDPAYEMADLVEHVTVSLPGLFQTERLIEAAGLTREQLRRYSAHRRRFAAYWLFMLLPGNPAHDRNPPGSIDTQARHVLDLLR